MTSRPILFYPRTTPSPLTLRWVVEPGLVRFSWHGGLVEARELAEWGAMPDVIVEYLERGELAHIALSPGAIETTLPEGGSWQARRDGTPLAARLRHDLFTVLSSANQNGEVGWPTGTLTADAPDAGVVTPVSAGTAPAPGAPVLTAATVGGSTDAELRAATQELLRGAAGDFAASHGGTMRLANVQDGVVRITMGGACRNCPAINRTLLFQVERQLRPYFPTLVRVEEA